MYPRLRNRCRSWLLKFFSRAESDGSFAAKAAVFHLVKFQNGRHDVDRPHRLRHALPAGQASQTDLLKAQNARSKRKDQWLTDRNRLAHERLTLNRMLGRELHAPWPALELPPVLKTVEYNQRLVDYALKFEPKIKSE